MSKHWLRNYYDRARQLHYDTESGEHTEHRAQDMDEADLAPRPGAFVDKEGEMVGVSPSADGPVFFRGDLRVLLVPGHTQATLTEVEGETEFVLKIDSVEMVRFRFRSDPDEEFDPFTGERDEFFDWLTDLIPQPHFYPLFTID